MTAVILAGGDGMRMRPLTCSLPKSMLRVCNIPLLEYNVSLLAKCGIKDIIIAADRFSNLIAEYFDTEREVLPRLSFSSVPEGTSAALCKAVKDYGIKDGAVLVVNGSALSGFDFAEITRAHKYGRNAVTAVLKKTVRPYDRITASAKDGLINELLLSQPRESCISDLALTGTFVIDARLAENITKYGSDIYTDAFPALIKEGTGIGAFEESGYFSHLQVPEDLLKVNADVLGGVYPYPFRGTATREISAGEGTAVESPVCIGENTEISSDVLICEKAVIGRNVTIGKGAKIRGCVIGDGVHIGEKCTLNHAVIGGTAIISAGASVFEGAVIGEGALISESAVINPAVKIWNGRHVEPFACAAADLKFGFARPVIIDDDGITGETNGAVTPQTASVIGSSLVSAGRKIAVGFRGTSAARALAMALSSGIMAAGGEAWFIGEASEPELSECVRICGASAGCYIDAGISARIKFFSSDGLSLSRREEKLIEGGINRGEYRRSGYSHFGFFKDCPDIKELYRGRLMKQRPAEIKGIRAVISAPERRVAELCELLLQGINDREGAPVVFHISADGAKLSAYTEETGYVFHDKLTLLCCREVFEEGYDVSLPVDFPSAADELAKVYGRRVFRYSGCPSDKAEKAEKEARKLAAATSFAHDGAELMLKTLSALSKRGKSLKEACSELPEFAEINRFVALDPQKWHHMNILRELCTEKQYESDGILINDKRGKVRIRPVKTGKGVMMHVESTKIETAGELCDFYQDTLNALSKKGFLKQ